MTSKELGSGLGYYSSLFTPDQLDQLAQGHEIELDMSAGHFMELFESAEELNGSPIAASAFRSESFASADNCGGKGIKLVCVPGTECCLYVKFRGLRPIFSVCCG